jgi:hypothetical protein
LPPPSQPPPLVPCNGDDAIRKKTFCAVTFCLSGLYIVTSSYVKGMVKSMALFSKNSAMLLPCFFEI